MDFAYLESFAAGDRQVIAEVLALFVEQAELWRAQLAPPAESWSDTAHSIKGAARGIGAAALGDVADKVEREGPEGIADLLAALDEVLNAIAGYRASTRSV